MVAPLPHKAAHKARVLHDLLLVIFRIPGAVAHGVDVLALDERHLPAGEQLVRLSLREKLVHLLGGGVHPAVQVQHGKVRGGVLFVGGDVLIVEQPGGVILLHPAAGDLQVFAPSAFVAHGPDHHSGVVLVPHHAALDAVQHGLLELGVGHGGGAAAVVVKVAQLGHGAVAFQIRLGNGVQAVLGAQLQKPGGVGIVAGADGVDVVALHQDQVLLGLLPGDGVAGDRVAVVAVDAPELDGHPVEVHHPVLDLHLPQAHLLGDDLPRGPQGEGVLGGGFRVPQHRVIQLKHQRLPLGALGLAHLFPAGGEEGGLHLGPAGKLQLHRDGGVGEVRGEALFYKVIPDVLLGPQQQVHVPENAAHAQLVLVLQVGAVAPLEHQHRQGVVPGGEEAADLKLGGSVGHLAVSHKLPVDPQVEAGIHPLKVQVDLVGFQGFLRHVQVADIQPARVFLGNIGRVKGDGVADVGVLVAAIAVVLPTGGHGDGAHLLLVERKPLFRVYSFFIGIEILKGPGAV